MAAFLLGTIRVKDATLWRQYVARFADLAALRRWHDSPEYQALVPLRMAAADVVLTAYEG